MRVGALLSESLDLRDLKHLQLIGCPDIDPFLRSLTPFNLNLLSLCIDKFRRQDTREFACDEFISSLKPLKRIILTFSEGCYFEARTLQPHYSSLETLRIEEDPSEPLMASSFGQALLLEQLALSGGFYLEDGCLLIDGSDWFSGIQDLLVCVDYASVSKLSFTD